MIPKSAIRLPISFHPDSLQEELKLIPETLWQPILSNHTASYWKAVAFRSYDAKATTLSIGDNYFNTSLFEELKAFRNVINSFQCNLKRVRLSRLDPGGVIGLHRDIFPGDVISEVRIQMPIQINKNAIFIIEKKTITMEPGELWYFDVSKEHGVQNMGTQHRINLIIDCEINEWIMCLIPQLNNH